MNAKQRAEFNAMFLKMEKELRNKSYQRPVSKQVSAARDFVDALALAKHADCACVCVCILYGIGSAPTTLAAACSKAGCRPHQQVSSREIWTRPGF